MGSRRSRDSTGMGRLRSADTASAPRPESGRSPLFRHPLRLSPLPARRARQLCRAVNRTAALSPACNALNCTAAEQRYPSASNVPAATFPAPMCGNHLIRLRLRFVWAVGARAWRIARPGRPRPNSPGDGSPRPTGLRRQVSVAFASQHCEGRDGAAAARLQSRAGIPAQPSRILEESAGASAVARSLGPVFFVEGCSADIPS